MNVPTDNNPELDALLGAYALDALDEPDPSATTSSFRAP